MPKFDKWLTEASADDSVAQVARRALKHRLRAVRHFLEHAEGATWREPEAVHQLRVWSRRAVAAVQLFWPLLGKCKRRRLKKTLRRLRRLGGDARDNDILLAALAERETTGATLHLARQLRQQREAAQKPIDRAKRKLIDRGKLKSDTAKLLDKLRWRKGRGGEVEPPFGDWVRGQLQPLADEFFTLGDQDLTNDAALHPLRIAGKRLRYALELATTAWPQLVAGGAYEQLAAMQDRLGKVCDHLASIERLSELLSNAESDDRSHLEPAIDAERKHFALAKRKFVRWWTPARRRSFRRQWNKALEL